MLFIYRHRHTHEAHNKRCITVSEWLSTPRLLYSRLLCISFLLLLSLSKRWPLACLLRCLLVCFAVCLCVSLTMRGMTTTMNTVTSIINTCGGRQSESKRAERSSQRAKQTTTVRFAHMRKARGWSAARERGMSDGHHRVLCSLRSQPAAADHRVL